MNYGYTSQPFGYYPPQQNNNGLIWVQGEAGAKSYMVAPGNTVLLLDSERPTFYIKSTDQNGMPQPLKIYDFAERVTQPEPNAAPAGDYVTRAEFDALVESLNKDTKKGKKND